MRVLNFLYRSTERRRSSQCNDAYMSVHRRSSSPGGNTRILTTLGVPVQDKRRASLNTLTVPETHVRRRSYSGPSCSQLFKEPLTSRRKSSIHSLGFNPFVEKLSSECVKKVIIGMLFIFAIVLLASLIRLLT